MKDKRQNRLVLAALAVLTLGAMALSLCVGSQGVALPRLLAALRAGDPADPVRRIVLYVRLPRMAAGLCCGAAMAVAGALLQAVLNNAMASPNVIGVNAGAGFFALLAGVLLPQRAVPGAAFAGALVTALLIYLLALRAGLARTTLVLAGLAVSGILTAGVNTMRLLFPEGVTGADGFLIGGLSGVSLTAVGSALPYLAAGGGSGALSGARAEHSGPGGADGGFAGPAGGAHPAGVHFGGGPVGGGGGELCGADQLCGAAGAPHRPAAGGGGPPGSAARLRAAGGHLPAGVRHGGPHPLCPL